MTEEKFPAQNYKKNILEDCFEDAKKYFLEAFIEIDYAHAVMLGEQGIITPEEQKIILKALRQLNLDEIRQAEYDGTFEDLFYYLQREITKFCGDADTAGKLHTARSRNDIDVTLYRLYLRPKVLELIEETMNLRGNLLNLVSQHHETLIPAYTHTQPAQPTTMAHYLLSMAEVLGRDLNRLQNAYENINYCPLGAAAITTTGFPINRHRVAELMGFTAPTVNSYGSISAVDYFTELLGSMSALLVNIGKFAQEFLLMAMMEFNVVRLPDGFVQGSSIMPQKRNPVALEHIRAIASKALGESLGVFTAVHNTPFGDINDSEDDIQPLIYHALRDATRAVSLFAATIKSAKFNLETLRERAEANFITVTELADSIVRKENLPFRISHKIVGNCVKIAYEQKTEISHELLQNVAKEVIGRELDFTKEELKQTLTAEFFVSIRTIYGGSAPSETKRALSVENDLEIVNKNWFARKKSELENAGQTLQQVVDKIIG
ncbi:MAG: argininosuccinate lyase [Pyrinomonadaceae bacterium]|nr:argininosuccinate lyase [Pyrinomonadaceae bacterium]